MTRPRPVDARPTYGVVWRARSPEDRIVRLGADRFDVGITGREPGGQAAARNRGDGNQDLGPETRAVIPLRDPMAPILPSGTIGAVVSTVSLRNGEEVLLLGGR